LCLKQNILSITLPTAKVAIAAEYTTSESVLDEKLKYIEEGDVKEKVNLEVLRNNALDALLNSIDKKKERAVIWKMDLCIAPLVLFCSLFPT
jgi:hypothetical protein